MGRWSYLDTDEERLPEGMRRTGYDADTQTYTYTDERGASWVGVPGARYSTMRRANTEPRRAPAPPLPRYKSDETDSSIKGEEPAQVLHEPESDSDRGEKRERGKGKAMTFNAILGPQSSQEGTRAPQQGYLKRWSSVSKVVNKFMPKKLPELPSDDEDDIGEGESDEKPLPPIPRRRASTMSRFTKSAAEGVKQMWSDDSEFRRRRG